MDTKKSKYITPHTMCVKMIMEGATLFSSSIDKENGAEKPGLPDVPPEWAGARGWSQEEEFSVD